MIQDMVDGERFGRMVWASCTAAGSVGCARVAWLIPDAWSSVILAVSVFFGLWAALTVRDLWRST